MKEVFIKTLSMGIVLCILTACTGRPSPSTYSNSSATSSDSNVEADNKNTEPTATGFKNLTRPYYSVLGCGGESGYYETRARDDGSANVTYIDYSSQKEIYLCNAPGCAHDNEGCTSWISAENAGVFPLISSDHLLLIHRTYGGEEGKQSLSRIDAASLDGSNRKTLITFNNGERLGDVFCTNGESLICSLTTLVQLPDTLESTFTLCMIDLNTGERVDLYVEDTTDGIQPEFLGVTETPDMQFYILLNKPKLKAIFPVRNGAKFPMRLLVQLSTNGKKFRLAETVANLFTNIQETFNSC